MYESFYQMTDRPFLAAPLADRYYPASSIDQARETVARCIERGTGPAVVMGAAGTGKSMLCHVLARQLGNRFAIASLASARLCTRRALLQNILYELQLPYRNREEGELRLALVDFLQSESAVMEAVLLLVDEAHTLPLRLLEEIRMITNLVRDGRPLVRLVLAANLAFDERLAGPHLESLNQRIAARCYLQSMNRDETIGFVTAQLAAVGADVQKIMTPAALDAVYRATDGVPRLVNQVCDHALVLGAIGQQALIDAGGIEEAWADLQQLPIPCGGSDSGTQPAARDILEFGELDDEPSIELGDAGESATAPPAAVAESVCSPDAGTLAEPDAAECGSNATGPVVAIHRPDAEEPDESVCEPAADAEQELPLPFHRPEQAPEVELIFHGVHDPFDEPFEDEEVLVDPYASLEALNTPHVTLGDNVPNVANVDSADALFPDAARSGPHHESPIQAAPSVAESVACSNSADAAQPDLDPAIEAAQLPADDRDLLEIYDDAQQLAEAGKQATNEPRKLRPYRHLFADLRGRIAQ